MTEDYTPSSVPSRFAGQMLLAYARQLAAQALEFVYPPACIACGAATVEQHRLCGVCWASLRLIERPYCERLGHPLAADGGLSLVSPAALADPPDFARARAAVVYEGAARHLVHALKYSDRLDLTPGLAALMHRAGRELLAEADLLVPVPLHRFRLWQRRYNQAAILAAALAKTSDIPYDPLLLRRIKPTASQTALTKAQRRENLQGAFAVSAAGRMALAGKRVLLIDDVVTSGATANAAARVLLRAGAESVDVLSFATVVPGEWSGASKRLDPA